MAFESAFRRLVPASLGNGKLAAQFLSFATAGTIGFFVNVATVYSLRAEVGLYTAGAAGFLSAASVTWALNRYFTFRHRPHVAARRQWPLYIGVSLLGLALYYATYAGLVSMVPLCRRFPVLPVAAGSIAGLFANFALSHRIVFR